MTVEESKLSTVKHFCSKFSWPSESALRAIILNASTNGFQSAIKRVGRRVLIDEQEFFKCINRIQERTTYSQL
ncbi:DNA-binding protein [Candidatus Protochlamydia phocaeensis]|uniref:DNA-binding protein n=1 Tax=Candidatus Protochlamydia phocaeensis TaxID=1414722 RepID=UPI000AE7D6F1|nr:DNA-binding protein [Candidatus Protochlamydia phocaeensis]